MCSSDLATPIGEIDLEVTAPAVRSIVYDRYGGVMGSFALEDRQPVPLAKVPPVLVDAVLAIEDQRFYEHDGVDWTGTARALFENVGAGKVAQGGSTITQQLVKNTLSASRDRNLKTKAREAILALRLERELTKQQILENYLNVIYFGSGAYGVQAAAERYFDRPVSDLRLAGSALLAGIIQAPEALNPIRYPDRARSRRRVSQIPLGLWRTLVSKLQHRVLRAHGRPRHRPQAWNLRRLAHRQRWARGGRQLDQRFVIGLITGRPEQRQPSISLAPPVAGDRVTKGRWCPGGRGLHTRRRVHDQWRH